MGYDSTKIDAIEAIQIPVRINKKKAIGLGVTEEKYDETIRYKKADVQVHIEIVIDDIVYVENISLKKANRIAGFNQVDKRPVSTYKTMWGFDDEIEHWLKLFMGEILPKSILDSQELIQIKDQRQLFLYEIPEEIVEKIIRFFSRSTHWQSSMLGHIRYINLFAGIESFHQAMDSFGIVGRVVESGCLGRDLDIWSKDDIVSEAS